MKKFIYPFIVGLFCHSGHADLVSTVCLDVNRSIGTEVIREFTGDLGISEDEIDLEKTQVTLLRDIKVDDKLAEQYARLSQRQNFSLPFKELKNIYFDNNVRNLMIEYDFQNRKGLHNIVWASALVNDFECSIRHNGYFLLRREF